MNEDLMRKLKKILALTTDANPNEHQRQVAMEKAMELLQQHNLTIAQVEGFGSTAALKAVCETEWKLFKLDPWVRQLINATVRLYYCDWYKTQFQQGGTWYPVFIGTPENIAVCKDITKWLMDAIKKEASTMYRGDRLAQRSFCLGAAGTIRDRVHAMREAEKVKPAAGTGTSLVLVRNQLEQLNEEAKPKNLQSTKTRPLTYNAAAGAAGKRFAGGLNLGRQVGGKTTAQIGG